MSEFLLLQSSKSKLTVPSRCDVRFAVLMDREELGLLEWTATVNVRSLEQHIDDTAKLQWGRASIDESTHNIKIRHGQ